MAPADPGALARAFMEAMNAGDIAGALELWVAEPVMIGPGGETISGRGELERTLRRSIEQGISFEIALAGFYVAGAVALAHGTLTLRGGRAGEAFEQTSTSTVVYARSEDGWRIAIDAPWGLPEGSGPGAR
jgi:ketosteroid isomerase-like protein